MPTTTNKLLIKSLTEFGLSEKEAKVYLALTELEVAAVSEIAETANINRSSAYVVLGSLKKKGLVSASEDKKIQRYVAISPEILLYEAQTRSKKAEEIKNKICEIIPELKALHKDTRHRPKVRVYEGINSLREAYYNMFSTNTKDLRTYANPAEIIKILPDFIENHNTKRIRAGIKMYAINPATKESFQLLENYQKYSPPDNVDEIILIPKSKFRFSSDFAIYGDRIALVSIKEKFGIVIESKEMAELLKNTFDLVWEEAKRISKGSLRKIKKVN